MAGTTERMTLSRVSSTRMKEIVHEPSDDHRGLRKFAKWYGKRKWADRALARKKGVLNEPSADRLPQ